MKKKSCFIVFIAAYAIIGSFFGLWAQEINNNNNNNLLDVIGFDINGEVTDTNGNPLDNVLLFIQIGRPDPENMMETEYKTNSESIGSKFRVQKTGYSILRLSFHKDGYYDERFSFDNNISKMDISKPILQKNIQVKMTKIPPRAKKAAASNYIVYNFEDETKSIFDLSAFSEQKKGETESTEVEKKYQINIKTCSLKTKDDTKKYIELDFKRDEKGNIVYADPSLFFGISYPTAYIVRFHSDNPGDGFILMEDFHSKPITLDDFNKKYTTAPEKGYNKREITIELKKNKNDTHYSFEKKSIPVYIKVGGHFGKAIIKPVHFFNNNTKIRFVRVGIDLDMNKKEGDRSLVFY